MNAHPVIPHVSSQSITPINTGCGTIYELLSPEFFLAVQTQKGELHVHHRTREIYVCVGGEGMIEYGADTYCPIKPGDVFDIEPGMLHALSASSGTSVSVLVLSFPLFNSTDYEVVALLDYPRHEKKPDCYIAAVSCLPDSGMIVVDTDFTLMQFDIKDSWKATEEQEVFVVSGNGMVHSKDASKPINDFSAISMQAGDLLSCTEDIPLRIVALKKF